MQRSARLRIAMRPSGPHPPQAAPPCALWTAALALLVASACKGPPARLVVGESDTVIVNNLRPVRLPVRVLDVRGHELPDTGVRFEWTAGATVPVSRTGVVTCTQPGDATVRAALGPLATDLLVRCRPVREVRVLRQRMLNLVVGEPAQELLFEAIGMDGRPVTLLTARVSIGDSTIATLEEGLRVRARAPGSTHVLIRVGDAGAVPPVEVYARGPTPEGLRPGQHVAVPVRLAAGEMRRWRLVAAREPYSLKMLPDRDGHPRPGLTVVGANCERWPDAHSFFCIAPQDAWVYVYYPQRADPAQELSGTLAVWRAARP